MSWKEKYNVKQHDPYPLMPVRVWIFSCSIALVLLFSLYTLLGIRDKRIGLISHVYSFSNSVQEKPDAYFLGSSLTSCALIEYHTFDSLLARNPEGFRYKMFIGPAITLDHVKNRITELKMIRPDYLFIESNLACVNMEGNVLWKWLKYRERLARIPVYLFHMKSNPFTLINQYVPGSFIDQNKFRLDIDDMQEDDVSKGGERLKIRRADEFPEWMEFFSEAAALGINVFLLEVPRSMEAEERLPEKFKQGYDALVKQYVDEYGIGYISFPHKLGRSGFYRDRAHFNRAGSKAYSEWFISELSRRNIISMDN